MKNRNLSLCSVVVLLTVFALAADKPKITLDEFFNAVDFTAVKVSPDGHSVVIGAEHADWEQNIFRQDLWLYRDDGRSQGALTQLTQSGHDSKPEWSPDGRWIAFLSERKPSTGKEGDSGDSESKDKEGASQLYLVAPSGGEAFPATQGEESVHAFAWSPDSRTLYFATRTPWTKAQKDAYKKEWKDVEQYRAAERGDMIFSLEVADALARNAAAGTKPADDSENASGATPGSHPVATTPWRAQELVVSPDGRRLAFMSESISERNELIGEYEIYAVDLVGASVDRPPRQLTHNEAVEQDIRWAHDNKHVFFEIEIGSVEGKYKDTQPRLYWVNADTGDVQRWASDFGGAVSPYALTPDGAPLLAARLGTEVQLYSESQPSAPFAKRSNWPGTYEHVAAAERSPKVAFVYSSLEKPAEVYLADSIDKLADARPITSFNKLFTERDLPKGKLYRWTAEDGTQVEGMLMYPPGKFEAKNLPMFVFIHGGPADADGDHFEADWYVWDRLAANQGWLVFEPNYRGSSGYGDKFLMGIVPEMVSRPGKDILAGVDALVKDGIADPDHLAIGGYSYGGYMTNWLITQTTRFKAAVTGAGAVENVANWGNDDTTFDDAYFLGGLPWEAAQRYHDEAAIFQIDKVKTPTHMVAGADDIRVAVLEDYLLDRALHTLGVPSTLLLFPGEGHSLDKDPWHGKIKVREELKWLQKYGGIAAAP
ncbi:MAG: prolyl oligopeptidase family serine peptidase [Acidobacteriia bacterium]|nr:prolyl oligopeptidase family serine peptidase [Terriglobia bacterium]